MLNDKSHLSKDQAEKLLERYLHLNRPTGMNFVYLNNCRAEPFDMEIFHQSDQIRLEDLRRYLGVKKLGEMYNLDIHYGQLSTYAWLKIKNPAGAGFSPVFDMISKIQKLFPDEEKRLDSISRRIAYLCFLREEIKYMNKKYDYREFPIIFEFYTNKVEVFTTLLVDLLMIIAEFWCERPGSTIRPRQYPHKFEDLLNCFAPLKYGKIRLSKSINTMLELSAAIVARHEYVHGIGPIVTKTNYGGDIKYDIPANYRYGDFEHYMRTDLYNSQDKLPPAGKSVIVRDERFPDFEFEIRRAKKGQFDYEGSGVRYTTKVSQYVKMLEGILWTISRAAFAAILDR